MSFNWTNIKSWTNIGGLGKELKSITLANGKVFEIADGLPTIPTNAITVKNTQYSSLVLQTNSQSSTTSFMLNDYTRVGARPTVNTPFVIYVNTFNEQKNMQIKSSALYFYDKNSNTVASFDNMQNKYWDIVEGHKYLFENGKDPVDLGEYGTTTPAPIITIKDTEYSSAPIGALGLHLVGLASSSTFKSAIALAKADPDTKSPTIIIEMKIPATIMTPDGTYSIGDGPATNEELNDNWLWFDMGSSWDSTHNIKLTAGHKYQFEQGKMPIDLGPYVSSAPKTIKATEYTSLGVNHVVSSGQDLIELAFVGLRGSSLEAFNSMQPTSSPSTAPQITPLIIQFIDEKLFGAIDYKAIRLSSFSDTTFTKSYLKCDVQTSTVRNFVHLHAYQFEGGKDPVDLGVY